MLVLPDPLVLGPLFAYYGGDSSIEAQRRAHYAGMYAKSAAGEAEASWAAYTETYTEAVGVATIDQAEAAQVLDRTLHASLWRWMIPESREALERLGNAQVPMGVVSNASRQIEGILRREVCQVGSGTHVAMRCIVDSGVVGVAKPDPAIFDHALPHFSEFEPSRIAYVGDSVTMDIAAASGAGLHAILLDPYDDHVGADFERIQSIDQLADELIGMS